MSFRLCALLVLSLVAVASAACNLSPTTTIVAPPQLQTSTSLTRLTTDLRIAFTSPNGQLFSSVAVTFKNPSTNNYGGTGCDVSFTNTHLAQGANNLGSNNAWGTSPTLTGTSCDTAFNGLWSGTALANALSTCFAFDNTTDGTYNFFTANVLLVTVQDRLPIRGVPVTRTVSTYTRFQFRLQRTVSVSHTPTVAGGNLASADIIDIRYSEIVPGSSTTGVITVLFFTSTPAPYKLTPWTVANLYGAGFSGVSSGIGISMANPIPYSIEQTTYPAGVNGPSTLTCLTADPYCNQLWQVRFSFTGVGSSGTCSPSATIRFSYSVQCNGQAGCVNPGNANSYDLTSTISSTNLCSQVVQTVSITPSVATFKTDADAAAGANPSSSFNLGETIYIVTSLTSVGGPNLASASLVSFNLVSAITISSITLVNPKTVQGLTFHSYPNSGTTIRPGLSFVADTGALQFTDLNSPQALTITITWTVLYDIPLNQNKLRLQGGRMALLETPTSDDVSVTSAFVVTQAVEAPAAASSADTLAIVIGAVGGFCVVALVAALFLYHRHVKNMMAKPSTSSSQVQIFVPAETASAPAAPTQA